MANQLIEIFKRARDAVGFHHIHDQYGDIRGTITKPAASGGQYDLRSLQLPAMVGTGTGHRMTNPLGTAAGKVTTVDAAVIEQSRVAQAGAVVFTMPSATRAIPMDLEAGVPVLARRPASFTTIQPAHFGIVADSADVTTAQLPMLRASVDLEDFAAYGFRLSLSRADQKEFGEGVLSDAALASIALGLAAAADQCLLSALAAGSLPAFTLQGPATMALRWDELAAVVGTNAAGAAYADGRLRVQGVPAELTDRMAGTVVGAFDRAAVCISEEITLIADRVNQRGDLNLTCWANIQALIPSFHYFWKVA